MKLRRSPAVAEDFDVVFGGPTGDPYQLAKALNNAGVDARVVLTDDDEPVVKIRHDDVAVVQSMIERARPGFGQVHVTAGNK